MNSRILNLSIVALAASLLLWGCGNNKDTEYEVYELRVSETEVAQRKATAIKMGKHCLYDEVTKNVLCDKASKLAKQYAGPLVAFDMCSHKERTAKHDPEGKGFPILMRMECAETVWKINAYMKKKTGKCLRLTPEKLEKGRPHFRTNAWQSAAYARYQSGTAGIAARPGYGVHLSGCALDILNWMDAEPFVGQFGWRVGRYNCNPHDPWHMQPGELCPPVKGANLKKTFDTMKARVK